MNQLGKYLTKIRKSAGLTQRKISDDAEYTTPQYVSNVERDLIMPSADYVARLARMTGQDYTSIVNKMFAIKKEEFLAEIKRCK